MKIKYTLGIITVAAILSFNSCDINNLYDSDEIGTSNQDELAVYKDPSKAKYLVDQIYALIPTFATIRYNGFLSAYSDEAIDLSAFSFNLGSLSPNNVPGFNDMWSGSYKAIRTANKFLENIDKMPFSDQYNFTESTKNYMINQVRCLRAYFYSELIRCYGGVPITTKSVKNIYNEIDVEKRQTLDSTVNFVIKEIDSITPNLPKNVGGSDYGRVTRGFALSIKSRLLLYMASPLFNSAGADGSANKYVCYGEYDIERWKKALDAARDVIALNSYSLFTSTTVIPSRSVYCNVFFLERGNASIYERIFSCQKAIGNTWNQTFLPLTFRTSAGWPSVFPSYNAHIAFQMQDGKKPISQLQDNGDGTYTEVVNPESTTYTYNSSQPYLMRDSRYYDCILFNQANYRDLTCQIYTSFADNEDIGSGKDNETYNAKTGFYLRKFVNPSLDLKGASQTGFEDFPVYRYAEILLNYAEAMNEVYGPNVKPAGYPYTAVQAVNLIRSRAKSKVIGQERYRPTLNSGMPALSQSITKEDMTEAIRYERRIELMFEGHRFFDVRRWMIAPETEKNIYFYDIRKKADGTFVYYIKKYHNRVFSAPQMYLLPIPFDEIQLNKNCPQNPGW